MYLLFVDSFPSTFLVSINLFLFHMHFNSQGYTHVGIAWCVLGSSYVYAS